MKKKPEALFSDLLRRNLKTRGVEYTRIESGGTSKGIPDVNMYWEGQEIWVELKVVKGRKVLLSNEQCNFFSKRRRARNFIVARQVKGKSDLIHIWRGRDARQVKDYGLDAPTLATFTRNSRKFPWDDVIKTLFLV